MSQQSTVELQCNVIAVVDKVLAATYADRWCTRSGNAAVKEIVLVVDGVLYDASRVLLNDLR